MNEKLELELMLPKKKRRIGSHNPFPNLLVSEHNACRSASLTALEKRVVEGEELNSTIRNTGSPIYGYDPSSITAALQESFVLLRKGK